MLGLLFKGTAGGQTVESQDQKDHGAFADDTAKSNDVPEAGPTPDNVVTEIPWASSTAVEGTDVENASPVSNQHESPLGFLLFKDRSSATYDDQLDELDADLDWIEAEEASRIAVASHFEEPSQPMTATDTVSLVSDGTTSPLALGGGIYDVQNTIPIPGGWEVHCVTDFDCATDRLVLDFQGRESEAPHIAVAHDTDTGHAMVEANGIAIVLVENAPNMRPEHVDVIMSDQAVDGEPLLVSDRWSKRNGCDPDLKDDPLQSLFEPQNLFAATPTVPVQTQGEEPVDTIPDFDPEFDQVEILFDANQIEEPEVTVIDFEDGTGASILLNGEMVTHVIGAQGLDPAKVLLRPSDSTQVADEADPSARA